MKLRSYIPRISSSYMNLVWLVGFALTLPAAVVISTQLARRSFEKVRIRDQVINVKGYAEQRIRSDQAMWSATLTTRGKTLPEAYEKLEASRERFMKFFEEHAFTRDRVGQSSVSINTFFVRDEKGNQTTEVAEHSLSQRFSVQTEAIERVEAVARDAGALIGEGMELEGYSPVYLYTKLDDLKLALLEAAAKNGRERAERLVEASSGRLGKLRSASQGVFQITPPGSTEVSSVGQNDTSSLEKVVKAVVSLEFGIE